MADKRFTVKSAPDLLAFAVKLEERDKKVYHAYIQKSNDIGVKKLVKSIYDGEEAHLEQIEEDKTQNNLEGLKVEPFALDVPGVILQAGPSSGGNVSFLRFAAEREAAVAGIYRQAAAETEGTALGALFSTLADGEEKHRDWFQDRLELEELKG